MGKKSDKHDAEKTPQSRFGENLPTYLQNKASSSQFTCFFGDSTEIRPKKWHSQRNTKLNSNFDGFGGESAQTKVQKESPGENRGRIYLPTSGIMFVTFFFHAACFGGKCFFLFFHSTHAAPAAHFNGSSRMPLWPRGGGRQWHGAVLHLLRVAGVRIVFECGGWWMLLLLLLLSALAWCVVVGGGP